MPKWEEDGSPLVDGEGEATNAEKGGGENGNDQQRAFRPPPYPEQLERVPTNNFCHALRFSQPKS